jgi:hypothetical protein
VSIPVTGPVFRWIIIGTLSAIPAGFLIVLTCAAPIFGIALCLKRKHPDFPDLIQVTHYSNVDHQESDGGKGKKWMNLISMVGLNIYAIVSLEETISRNHLDPSEKTWTFGQILAIFLLVGVVNEMMNLWLASLDRKAKAAKDRVATAGIPLAPVP